MTRRRPVIGHLARVQRLAEAGLLPGGERHAVVDEVEGCHGCGRRLRPSECRVKFGQFMDMSLQWAPIIIA